MEKIIEFEEGKSIAFKSTAWTPVKYANMFPGCDFLKDVQALASTNGEFPPGMLVTFSQIAYTMAKQADPGLTDDLEEFLDQFEIFDIIKILPELLELWQLNAKSTSKAKKKSVQQSVK